jgi:plastocyanin
MTTTVGTTDHEPVRQVDEGGPGRWSRLASLGFLMAAAGPVLMIAAVLLWGLDSGDLAFFVVPAVLGAAAAALVRKRRRWQRVLAIVLGLLAAVMMFWTMFGITSPASFFDFVPALLVVPGALIGLVAGVASARAAKGGAATESVGERRAIQGILVALGTLVVVSAVVSVSSRETVSDAEAAAADIVVDLKDFEFDAERYDAAGGTTILVKNSDPFLHTFTIDELGIDVSLNGGSEKLVSIPAQPGTYVVYCEPHTSDKDDPGEDDMAAALTVG